MCKNTATLYVEDVRNAIFEFYISSNEKIGGFGGDDLLKIIKIDESLFLKPHIIGVDVKMGNGILEVLIISKIYIYTPIQILINIYGGEYEK